MAIDNGHKGLGLTPVHTKTIKCTCSVKKMFFLPNLQSHIMYNKFENFYKEWFLIGPESIKNLYILWLILAYIKCSFKDGRFESRKHRVRIGSSPNIEGLHGTGKIQEFQTLATRWHKSKMNIIKWNMWTYDGCIMHVPGRSLIPSL